VVVSILEISTQHFAIKDKIQNIKTRRKRNRDKSSRFENESKLQKNAPTPLTIPSCGIFSSREKNRNALLSNQ